MKILIIILIFSSLKVNSQFDKCDRWSHMHLTRINNGEFFNQIGYLVQFRDFLNLINIPCNKFKINIDYLGIRPRSRIPFQTDFDFIQLANLFTFERQPLKILAFLNFNGFNKQSRINVCLFFKQISSNQCILVMFTLDYALF
jgi:hypothetical protein